MSNGFTLKFNANTKGLEDGVDRAKQALKDWQKELRENKKEQRELSKEVKNAEKELRELEEEIEKNGKATAAQEKRQKQLNDTVKEAKERLEELKVTQAGIQKNINDTKNKIEQQKKALDEYKDSIDKAKKSAGNLAKTIGTLTAAGGAAIGGMLKYSKDAAQWADDLNTLSKVTGLSTEELQKLAYASNLVDVSTETLTGSLSKLTNNMRTAVQTDTSAAAQAFEKLKVSIQNTVTGELRDRNDVFSEVIDKLQNIGNETERDALAMAIFGKSAQELNPLIMGGSEALKELGDQAERAGLILSQDDLDALNEFNDQADSLSAKGTQISKIIAGQAKPAVEGLLDVADELLDDVKKMADSGELETIAKDAGSKITGLARSLKNLILFVNEHKKAVIAAAGAIAGWKIGLSVGTIVNSLITALKAAKIATDEETASQLKLNAAMSANPIGLVVALIGSLVAGLTSYAAIAGTAADKTDELNKSHENYLQTLEDAQAAARERETQTNADIDTLKSLESTYDDLRKKVNLTTGEEKQLDNIAKDLASTLGISAEELKNKDGKYKSLSGSVDEYIEKLREEIRLESSKEQLTAAYKSYNAAAEGYTETAQAIEKQEEKVKQLKKANEENYKLIKEMNEFTDHGGTLEYETYKQKYEPAVNQIDELEREQDALKKLKGDLGEYQFQVVQAAGAIGQFEEEIGSSTDALDREGQLIDKAISGTGKLEQQTSSSGASAENLSGTIDDLANSTLQGKKSISDFYDEFQKGNDALENAEYALTAANKALEDNRGQIKGLRDAAEEARKTMEKADFGSEAYTTAAKTYEDAKQKIAQLKTEQVGLNAAVKTARENYDKAAWSAKTLTDKLTEYTKTSSSLRSELSSLADTYKSLNDGQELSLDTLLQLSEKYPEYAAQLLNAAGNADKQKTAVEALYNAKKALLIQTMENAKAELESTKATLDNTKAQLAAIEAAALRGELWAKSDMSYIRQLKDEISELTKEFENGTSKITAYQNAIDLLKNTGITNYKPAGSTSAGSPVSGNSQSSTAEKTVYTTKGGDWLEATGDTAVSSQISYLEKAAALGRWNEQQQIDYLNNILRVEQVTADERYQIQLKLNTLTEKLREDAEKKRQDAEKQRQEDESKARDELLEKQKYALAAYEHYINNQQNRLKTQSELYQKRIDNQIKAIDDELSARQQAKEDDSRQKELEAVEFQLKSGRNDEISRSELERKRQDILNEQYEVDYQRQMEQKKADLQEKANDLTNKNTAAIDKLSVSLDNFAYALAKASNSQTVQQVVNHNTKNQNIKFIQQSGLSKQQIDAAVKAIYSG